MSGDRVADWPAFRVANEAGVAGGPFGPASVGGVWLRGLVEEAVVIVAECGDDDDLDEMIWERAATWVPIPTPDMWALFTDLALWAHSDDLDDSGPWPGITEHAEALVGWAAERVLFVVVAGLLAEAG